MDVTRKELLAAQQKAASLFQRCVDAGTLQAGLLESEISESVYKLAREHFGVRRHWHRRIVRSGPNTLLTYFDEGPDRRLQTDDILFLDFGPVFDGWEADYARTYVIGDDPDKLRLAKDLDSAIVAGKAHYQLHPDITAGEMYEFICNQAVFAGWEFGSDSAGHPVGRFPHEGDRKAPDRFSIRAGNGQKLNECDPAGTQRHWILEAHFIDRKNQFGGFVEELLTI